MRIVNYIFGGRHNCISNVKSIDNLPVGHAVDKVLNLQAFPVETGLQVLFQLLRRLFRQPLCIIHIISALRPDY